MFCYTMKVDIKRHEENIVFPGSLKWMDSKTWYRSVFSCAAYSVWIAAGKGMYRVMLQLLLKNSTVVFF